jgi:hypothetical protein
MPSSTLIDTSDMMICGPSGGRIDFNRCAGCRATDVSLLACDDIDSIGGPTDPTHRARYERSFDFCGKDSSFVTAGSRGRIQSKVRMHTLKHMLLVFLCPLP